MISTDRTQHPLLDVAPPGIRPAFVAIYSIRLGVVYSPWTRTNEDVAWMPIGEKSVSIRLVS